MASVYTLGHISDCSGPRWGGRVEFIGCPQSPDITQSGLWVKSSKTLSDELRQRGLY